MVFEGIRVNGLFECFGTLYYSELHAVEYKGGWCGGKRNGQGIQYDRNGKVVYEGPWCNDSHDKTSNGSHDKVSNGSHDKTSNDSHDKTSNDVVFTKLDPFDSLYSTVETIRIKNFTPSSFVSFSFHYLPSLTKVFFEGKALSDEAINGSFSVYSCPRLTSFVMKPMSCQSMTSFSIYDLPSLTELEIGDRCLSGATTVTIRDLPVLEVMQFGYGVCSTLHHGVIENLPALTEWKIGGHTLEGASEYEKGREVFELEGKECSRSHLEIRNLPVLKTIDVDGGQAFTELGELVVENVPMLEEIGGWYIFEKVYQLTATNAPKFKEIVEDHSDMLWTSKSVPFSVADLAAAITELTVASYTGNDMQSLTISGFAELVSVSVGCHCFSRVATVEVADLPRLSRFRMEHDCCIVDSPTASFALRRCSLLREFSMDNNTCMYYRHFKLEDTPALETISFEKNCFREGKEFELVDIPALKKVSVMDSSFYPVTLVRFENLPALEEIVLNYGALWGDYDTESMLIMKDLPSLTLLNVQSDFGFNYMKKIVLKNIPKLEDIDIVGGFKGNEVVEAENADYFKEFIERQRSRGY
ncbi:hypothetical protein WA577_007764 [Blastocystis sp. JDR]